ncbi:HD domain-containing protein [Betaproteobacteria bacterium SCN1]|jgi:HD-GYP domain-containing protein (c-di-GMP phosphodiesterase class II)|nr:HD domain-containing protein [Betaproteobacteria bacterium SCN1]
MSEHYDEHYIASVTAMGDTHMVTASQAIFTRNGIKLVNAGTRIDSTLRDRLIQHKLMPDIDRCLVVENGVTPASLRDAAREILLEERFAAIRDILPESERFLNAIQGVQLNAPLAFKLTVAREKFPLLFRHSLQVALIALFLGIRDRMNDRELVDVATAALFHDLGEMHIDPAVLGANGWLDGAALRQISVHSTTGYLILQAFPEYSPEIREAVLDHHERMDGSGYPRGVKGEEISPLSQVIMLSEVVATLLEQSWEKCGVSRLAMMLKMNRKRFSATLIDHIAPAFVGNAPNVAPMPAETLSTQLRQLAEVFQLWHATYKLEHVSQASALVKFVDQRLVAVERSLHETGFQPNEFSALLSNVQDDLDMIAEMQLMLRESQWMVSSLIKETQRRWHDFVAQGQGCARVEQWIERALPLLQTAPTP